MHCRLQLMARLPRELSGRSSKSMSLDCWPRPADTAPIKLKQTLRAGLPSVCKALPAMTRAQTTLSLAHLRASLTFSPRARIVRIYLCSCIPQSTTPSRCTESPYVGPTGLDSIMLQGRVSLAAAWAKGSGRSPETATRISHNRISASNPL